MIVQMQEYMLERGEMLRGQVRKIRATSVESVREAAVGSAGTLRALKSPVRVIARSGVKLTAVSQQAVQNLIELQSAAVTAALGELALRIERATRAENIVEFVRGQVELAPTTRDRMVEDANRAANILKVAGRDFRAVAKHAFASIADKGDKETVAAKPARRKTAKRATRKAPARARKTA